MKKVQLKFSTKLLIEIDPYATTMIIIYDDMVTLYGITLIAVCSDFHLQPRKLMAHNRYIGLN